MKRAVLSGFADESLPALSDLLPEGFDLEWLGAALGDYRTSTLAQDTMPSRKEELRYMKQAAKTLHGARELFAHQGLPPLGDATAHQLALKIGADWPGLRRRLRADLNQALALVKLSTERLAEHPSKGGAPTKHTRKELHKALVNKLRQTPMKADPARIIAEQVLTRCGIDVPVIKDGDTRAVRRAEGGKN